MKKSSQSKKVMRMLDKERRRKAKGIVDAPAEDQRQDERAKSVDTGNLSKKPPLHGGVSAPGPGSDANSMHSDRTGSSNKQKMQIQTEIRTDDFVVRLLLSNPFKDLYCTKYHTHTGHLVA